MMINLEPPTRGQWGYWDGTGGYRRHPYFKRDPEYVAAWRRGNARLKLNRISAHIAEPLVLKVAEKDRYQPW